MVRRHELTDVEWRVLNGIVFEFRSGVAWRDVPERYGSWRSPHTRFRRWAADGTFTTMLRAVQARADAAGEIDATRYCTTAQSYQAAVTLAALLMWL